MPRSRGPPLLPLLAFAESFLALRPCLICTHGPLPPALECWSRLARHKPFVCLALPAAPSSSHCQGARMQPTAQHTRSTQTYLVTHQSTLRVHHHDCRRPPKR